MNGWFWPFLTDFGDSAITGFVALFFAVYFLKYGQVALSRAALLSFFVPMGLIAVGKTVLYSMGEGAAVLGVSSPSGHAALSVSVYGVAASFFAVGLPRAKRFIPYILVVPFVLGIAVSRVVIGVHSVADIVVGMVVGGASAVFLVRRYVFTAVDFRFRYKPFVLLAVLLALVHGLRFPGDTLIHKLSALFRV